MDDGGVFKPPPGYARDPDGVIRRVAGLPTGSFVRDYSQAGRRAEPFPEVYRVTAANESRAMLVALFRRSEEASRSRSSGPVIMPVAHFLPCASDGTLPPEAVAVVRENKIVCFSRRLKEGDDDE